MTEEVQPHDQVPVGFEDDPESNLANEKHEVKE